MRTTYVFARKRLNVYVNVRLLRVSDLCAQSDLCVLCTSFARKRLIVYVNVRLLRVERLLQQVPTVSFDDVSY